MNFMQNVCQDIKKLAFLCLNLMGLSARGDGRAL